MIPASNAKKKIVSSYEIDDALKENLIWMKKILNISQLWSDYEDDKSIGKVQFMCDSGESKGKLVVYTLTHSVHGRTASEIVDIIKDSVRESANHAISRSIGDGRDVDCLVSGQGYKPVSALLPKNLHVGGNVLARIPGDTNPFPNVVIEVEYTHFPLPKLKSKLENWIGPSTSVQVAIGIKIMQNRRIDGRRRMIGLVYERGVDTHQDVEFGTNVSQAELDAAQLTFNAASLFYGVPVPVSLIGQVITIPLAVLQDLVAQLIPC